MKGNGKPAARYIPFKITSPMIKENRKCLQCGKHFTCVQYKISEIDYLCGKHKQEYREKEAEQIVNKNN